MKPIEIVVATEIAASVLNKITADSVTGKHRSDEQIALIVELVNVAIDAMFESEESDEPKTAEGPKMAQTKTPEIRVIPFSEIHEQLEKMFGGEK